MLQNSIGILSALAFVLGLVWVAIWVAKRYGALPSGPRTRIAIEVVQRVSLGQKSGLAVVRVGEKVMAVSMGPDGIRPLFELDEADRLRVLASSQLPVPMQSSVAAERAFTQRPIRSSVTTSRVVTNVLPGALARVLPANIVQMFQRQTGGTAAPTLPESFAASMKSALKLQNDGEDALPQTVSAGDRDFRNMLSMTLSTATRLAVFGGFVVLSVMSSSAQLSAQTAPPAVPPVVPPVVTTPVVTAPATQPAAAPPTTTPVTNEAAPAVTAPKAPTATQPAFVVPTGAAQQRQGAAVRPATTRSIPARATPQQTRQPATRTADQIAADKKSSDSIRASAAAKAPTRTLPGSATRTPGRPNNAAPAAAVAGGDDALAKMLPQMDIKIGDGQDGGLRLSGTVGIVVMMGLLTLVPTLVLMMTGFTRILIVLHFLKQAMGTQSAPPAQLLAAMALLLTGFVMAPTFTEVNRTALQPWMDGKITQVEMLKEGVKPMRVFMMKQMKTEADLKTFVELSHLPKMNTIDDVPLHVLMSAFVTHELREAFKIGFVVYLPFIIIDAVVSSVLMSMGMFMLPPAMISMPFKLLLFVLVDGWGLIVQELVKSFR
ncbi:MAG: flagellar type III secretion system pore protein FliP [Gemmatimonadaceae bacterium]